NTEHSMELTRCTSSKRYGTSTGCTLRLKMHFLFLPHPGMLARVLYDSTTCSSTLNTTHTERKNIFQRPRGNQPASESICISGGWFVATTTVSILEYGDEFLRPN